ncbi:helix-turn-helix domain-containing protein [Aminipila sp.]|uniref:helix-turn-helix domain-containing protein n=1 Tax=Aminipila sp. TaxID=2060095 RepID=UPI0028985943|nr:helix-turn-helix transcriptional regulator [Aminipila sp.]
MRIDKTALFIAMANKRISQKELAEVSGISSSTISHGFSNTVLPTTIGKLAHALNVPVEQIILKED